MSMTPPHPSALSLQSGPGERSPHGHALQSTMHVSHRKRVTVAQAVFLQIFYFFKSVASIVTSKRGVRKHQPPGQCSHRIAVHYPLSSSASRPTHSAGTHLYLYLTLTLHQSAVPQNLISMASTTMRHEFTRLFTRHITSVALHDHFPTANGNATCLSRARACMRTRCEA